MNIKEYDPDELLALGIKSEIEAGKVYRTTANRVKNPFLKNRNPEFLSESEIKILSDVSF